ncbi:actin-histidine N-methyltransferase-like [Daphnia pulex]|uniref:actin-histidine N-methyltransferase-like n=1 Tax=Daphnia pulex TaxID=6669 RepID=UPI001EDCCA10|nr:actin-histidine N-methyltransferase-like [Daphnia pulex]
MGKKSNGDPNLIRKGLTRGKREELKKLVDELLQKCSYSVTSQSKDLEIYSESWTLLEKIYEMEKSLERPTVKRSDALPPFLEWMTNHDVKMGPVELVELPLYGCCVRATKQVSTGELLFSIPQKLMLSNETADSSTIGHFINNDPILSQMPNVALAFHVLNELYDPKSFWKPYLDALPSSYDTVMYFTPDEITELKGSPAFDDALRMCRNIARQYSYFYSLLQKNVDPALSNLRANFTYNDYRWAVSTVMTRQNLIPSQEEISGNDKDQLPPVNALIPLWDFCNHQDGQFSTDFQLESRRTVCQAGRDFGPGEQVFIFYGTRTCAEQFIHNGFVDINNAHDALTLKVGLSKSDPLAGQRATLLCKLRILSDEKISGPIAFQLKAGPQPVDGKLLAFLRLFCMTKDSLDRWLQSDNASNLMHEECGIETEVDDKSWSFLKARCQLLLQLYPTTKEADLKMLEEDLSSHRRMCVLLRLAEKRILLSAIECAAQRIKK